MPATKDKILFPYISTLFVSVTTEVRSILNETVKKTKNTRNSLPVSKKYTTTSKKIKSFR